MSGASNGGWNPPYGGRLLTVDEWYREVERAASKLIQHAVSSQDGTVTVGNVEREDLLAVRREDWDDLYQLLNPGG